MARIRDSSWLREARRPPVHWRRLRRQDAQEGAAPFPAPLPFSFSSCKCQRQSTAAYSHGTKPSAVTGTMRSIVESGTPTAFISALALRYIASMSARSAGVNVVRDQAPLSPAPRVRSHSIRGRCPCSARTRSNASARLSTMATTRSNPLSSGTITRNRGRVIRFSFGRKLSYFQMNDTPAHPMRIKRVWRDNRVGAAGALPVVLE